MNPNAETNFLLTMILFVLFIIAVALMAIQTHLRNKDTTSKK